MAGPTQVIYTSCVVHVLHELTLKCKS
jgi:hypothetical protein